MFETIKQTMSMIGRVIKRDLEDKLWAWMNWTVYGTVEDELENVKGGAGTSQYTTYVIGPCVTRVYTGQK